MSTFIISLTFFSSCEKNDVKNPVNGIVTLIPKTIVGEASFNSRARESIDDLNYNDFEELARLLASVTSSAEVRSFLKAEALKKFDGDYDILYNNVKDIKISGKRLFDYLGKEDPIISKKVEELVTRNPLLNISIPLYAESWDTDKNNLLVVALESEDKPAVKAFDSDGKIYYLDHKVDPDVPVIVVGLNERVSFDNGKYERRPFISAERDQREKSAKMFSCSYPYRVNNNYEYIKEMKFLDLNQYESFTRGAPEIKCRVYAPVSSNNFASLFELANTGNMEPPNRAFINNAWWNNPDVPLFYWDNPNKAMTMLFHFWEMEDSGSSHSFTVGIGTKFKVKIGGIETEVGPNLSYTGTYKANDKAIGIFAVEQFICPPIPSDNCYQLGAAFQWKSDHIFTW
ncbi:hypothetical protein GCM10027275_29110 [Rhabdobacter roseus]